MSTVSLEMLQPIVDGHWRNARAARRACREDRWEAFLDEFSPSPPKPGMLSFRARRDFNAFQACRDRALELWSGPKEVRIELVPVWIGSHEGEEPDPDCWYRVQAISIDDDPLTLLGFGPYNSDADPVLDAMVSCRAKLWGVGNIVEARSYAPDIELALRRPPFGVSEGVLIELEEVLAVESERLLPRPTLEVPPYCSWTEPRVEGLAPELVRQLYRCSITVDDEGLIIERPADACLVSLT